jgi:proteasome assembly chaperone (PAC2) family protein
MIEISQIDVADYCAEPRAAQLVQDVLTELERLYQAVAALSHRCEEQEAYTAQLESKIIALQDGKKYEWR